MEMSDDQIKGIQFATALSNESLSEIGRVFAHFANLELNLSLLIHYLMGTRENISATIISELSFKTMQDIAMSLLMEHAEEQRIGETLIKKLRHVLGGVSECEAKRNGIAHSVYGSNSTNEIIRSKISAKRKKGLNIKHEKLSNQDVFDIAIEISTAAYNVKEIHIEIAKEMTLKGWVSPEGGKQIYPRM